MYCRQSIKFKTEYSYTAISSILLDCMQYFTHVWLQPILSWLPVCTGIYQLPRGESFPKNRNILRVSQTRFNQSLCNVHFHDNQVWTGLNRLRIIQISKGIWMANKSKVIETDKTYSNLKWGWAATDRKRYAKHNPNKLIQFMNNEHTIRFILEITTSEFYVQPNYFWLICHSNAILGSHGSGSLFKTLITMEMRFAQTLHKSLG